MKNNKNKEDYALLLKEEGIEKFIETVKLNDILINPYGGNLKAKNTQLINDLTNSIDERGHDYEKAKWDSVMQESKLINRVYSKFYDNPLNKIVHTENSLEAFLIVTEQFLQYVNNIVAGEEDKNFELGLNFSVIENAQVYRKRFYMDLHDVLTCEINLVLSSLKFYELPKHVIDINKVIDGEEINSSYNHFSNVQLNDLINYAVDSWKYGGRKVKKSGGTITFDILNDSDESYFIINERKDSKANKVYLSMMQIIKEVGESFPKGNKIFEYLNLNEFMTCFYLMDYLNVDDLKLCTYSINGINSDDVSIKELVRAYYLFIGICSKKIITRSYEINNLKNWGILLKKKEIQENFSENGIDNRNIDPIIEQLTYRIGVDIFDAPLIEINHEYLLLPNLLIKVDVAKLVLSLIDEISTRGLLFESEIKKRICANGFKCNNLYIRDSEEYQCDLAISIADDLYVCECKAWNEFKNITGYYNMLQKMKDAKHQLDRITDKFSKEMDYVNERLGFDKSHKFRNITKLVVTLNMLGLYRKIEDVYFVDISCLAKFLDREKPGIRTFGKHPGFVPFKGYKEYEGNINNFKFMTMVRNPANIEITRKNKVVGINIFTLDEIELQIPMYVPEHQSTRIMQ